MPCAPLATATVPAVLSTPLVDDELPICIAVNACACCVVPPSPPAAVAPTTNRWKYGSPASHEIHVQPAGAASPVSSRTIIRAPHSGLPSDDEPPPHATRAMSR